MTLFEKFKALVNAAFNPQNQRFKVICKLVTTGRFLEHLLDNFETIVEILPQEQNIDDPIHFVLCVDGASIQAWFFHLER